MANTYTLIDKSILGSNQTSVTFSSIPSTYTDLKVVMSARSTRTDFETTDVNVNFNASAANQTQRNVRGYPGGAISQSGTRILFANIPSDTNTTNIFCNNEMYITNYASSNNKSVSIDGVVASNTNSGFYWWSNLAANLWSNSSAITSITIECGVGDFRNYSSFYLYGIKNS